MTDRRRRLSGSLPAVLRRLAEQLRLEGEYVIEHAIDAPAFEPVVGDHAGSLELVTQRSSKRPVDSRPTAHLRLLEYLKAPVERELAQPVLANGHVPSTSTLPSFVTRTLTVSSDRSP